jgi:hypothetical protein
MLVVVGPPEKETIVSQSVSHQTHTYMYFYIQTRLAPPTTPGGAALALTPQRYLFAAGRGLYCLGVFDNGDEGSLLGGILTRNALVQVPTAHLCVQRLGWLLGCDFGWL